MKHDNVFRCDRTDFHGWITYCTRVSPVQNQSIPPIRILLVDDCELVRKGVRAILSAAAEPPIEVVAEAETAAEALDACARYRPDVVVLEANLPGAPRLELCRQIAARRTDVRLLVLTSSMTQSLSYDSVLAGAHGCVGKEIKRAALIEAIHDIASGGAIFDAARTTTSVSREGGESKKRQLHDLSVQQRRVLELLTAGHTNEEIAAELRLSKHTVRNYLVATFRKLGVRRRAQASALFMQQAQDAAFASI